MTATEILERFKDLGVSVQLSGDNIQVTPVSLVPGDLLAEAKAHKSEIVQELQPVYGDGLAPPLGHLRQTVRHIDWSRGAAGFGQHLARCLARRESGARRILLCGAGWIVSFERSGNPGHDRECLGMDGRLV